MKRRTFVRGTLALAMAAGLAGMSVGALAQGETGKVGVLHSLSGTMGIRGAVVKGKGPRAVGGKLRPAVAQPSREVGRDDERDLAQACVDRGGDLAVVLDEAFEVEILGCLEALQERPAVLTAVAFQNIDG